MRTQTIIKPLIMFALVILLASIQSCKEEEAFAPAAAPQIPPQGSFVMDFSDFQSGENQKFYKSTEDINTAQNWFRAATHVGFWNLVITTGLAVPARSFVVALNQEAEQYAANKWKWTYEFDVFTDHYEAELHAILEGATINWEMYITKVGVYEDFKWYTGTSNLTGTHGTWTLNESPNNRVALLGIEWNRNVEAGTSDIKYENIKTGDENIGGYIFYGITNATPLNAFYDLYNAKDNQLINIESSKTTKEGHIKAPHIYGDSQWHCWDSALQDVDCQ